MSLVVAGDWTAGSPPRPAGRGGGGMAMADTLELGTAPQARSWSRSRSKEGREKRSSSSKAAAISGRREQQRDVMDSLGFVRLTVQLSDRSLARRRAPGTNQSSVSPQQDRSGWSGGAASGIDGRSGRRDRREARDRDVSQHDCSRRGRGDGGALRDAGEAASPPCTGHCPANPCSPLHVVPALPAS